MRYGWYAIALVTAMLVGCNNNAKTDTVPQPQVDGDTVVFPQASPQLTSLVSETVAERQAAAVTLNGRLTWNEDKTVRIYTPFAGRVDHILAQPGDKVKQGQTLAVIASPDFGQAQAEARRAEGDFALAQQNLARVRDLHEHGVAAAKDLNAAEAEYARAESELQRTRARLKLYGGSSDIDQTYALKSPLTGVVVEKNINPGQELRPDQMVNNAPALFVITDPAYLWVQLDAHERELPKFKMDKTIVLHVPAYPDETFEAKITAVSDFLDPATRTIKVRAVLNNKDRRLKGEMFVTAALNSDTATVLQVPAKAVFFQGGRHYVFTDEGNGKFVRREVQIGDANEGRVTVVSGLGQAQKVVTDGTLFLQQVLQPRRVLK